MPETPLSETVEPVVRAAKKLARSVAKLRFAEPVTHVYNPLEYAWAAHEAYLRKFFTTPKRVLFLGMNPGPFGMVQTGVPFGEIAAVRDWLGIEENIRRPKTEHPRRPITGFATTRSEVSGQRLWGLFARRFAGPELFFRDHAVLNYCPLAFLESTGRNRTPDKLLPAERELLYCACDEHLTALVKALRPEWLIGVGDFAAKRAAEVIPAGKVKIGKILHPSPASPAANRDWAGSVGAQLRALGIWT
jgi:single-strand selective monofunctional uracil DNA glycosylase